LTRDYAIKRATQMRQQVAKLLMIAGDHTAAWQERYKAVVMSEEYEEAARRFDTMAEAGEHKRCR